MSNKMQFNSLLHLLNLNKTIADDYENVVQCCKQFKIVSLLMHEKLQKNVNLLLKICLKTITEA